MNDINLKNAEYLGLQNQMIVLSEELDELGQTVAKWLRHCNGDPTLRKSLEAIEGDLLEELADVSIVTDQIKHLMGISERELQRKRSMKILRTAEDIKRDKEKGAHQ